ncbi:YndJ family protein [Mangrovibacillus cuniculi]|uniref:YndJ family transporter n=1 Tax=Mangrovibacillus cuniculi TaxID=2593652 RepID=A0A7S8CAZ3_9BACI|nr:YndJ family protein [Mangrovibacillus cuniculi]QPC46526.1 YndJ family transporter [Mangrovibacillus cuniculi]
MSAVYQKRKYILFIVYICLFMVSVFFYQGPWYELILTFAQVVLVPIITLQIIRSHKLTPYWIIASIIGVLSVTCLSVTSSTSLDLVFAGVYLLYTTVTALIGLERLLSRGNRYIEEGIIDWAFIYLPIGGMWYFAHVGEIQTGFSPIITWMTSIHFHYAAFLLLIFTGLVGRVHKTMVYKIAATFIGLAPIWVAIGISVSRLLELFSVMFYLIGIGFLFTHILKTTFPKKYQKMLVLFSIGSLFFSLSWSLLYAVARVGFGTEISIATMILFHGITNCLCFGLVGILSWLVSFPRQRFMSPTFQKSHVTGGLPVVVPIEAGLHPSGLVDDFSTFKLSNCPDVIKDFYENTSQYSLFSSVRWNYLFYPLALCWHVISKKFQQLHLPVISTRQEMTGEISSVSKQLDGREKPRVWSRAIKGEKIFQAIYSIYEDNAGVNYMSISLPLPFCTMMGILSVHSEDLRESIKITSSSDDQTGVYLFVKGYRVTLPLSENFLIRKVDEQSLKAIHHMKIFGLPFLTIHYDIYKK